MPTLTTTRLEALIAAFAEAVDEPTPTLGAVGCVSLKSLRKLFTSLRNQPDLPWLNRVTNAEVLESLLDAALLVPVPGAREGEVVSADQLFAVGLSADPAKLDPLEILTALEPDGVICYFSAIVLHGLSTQFPSHQHIATLVAREPRRGRSAERHASSGVPPLGSLRTTIEGIPYFSTERTASLVAGTQRRVISERLVIRCTTPAQTLLDCLHRPHSCGGPAVVFEAWEHAPRVSTPDALVSLARTIDHPDLSRRLGYMLESADAPEWQLPDELPNQLEVPSGQAPIPLFPAAGHQRVDARWGLLVP